MSTPHTGEQASPALEWLVDELRHRVTTLEIELAHWEHAHAASPTELNGHARACRACQSGRRAAGTGGSADE